MERTELPISLQSSAFSLLSQCLYLIPLALTIFHFYNRSLQENQFLKAEKKLDDFLGLWGVYLL